MKKVLISLLVISLLVLCFPVSALAAEAPAATRTETVYKPDGSYVVYETTVYESLLRASTKTARQTGTGYNSSGSKVVSMTLTASFSYSSSSATATKASATCSFYKTGWKKDSGSTYCSGDTAYADGYFSSGSDDCAINLSLTCDTQGNIS